MDRFTEIKERVFAGRLLTDDMYWLIAEIKLQKDENKRLRTIASDLRRKTSFRVFEENLALVQEIEKYKEMIKGNEHDVR